jgi:hypothetical protein
MAIISLAMSMVRAIFLSHLFESIRPALVQRFSGP